MRNSDGAGVFLILIVLTFSLGLILGGVLWPYSIETSFGWFDKHVDIPWYAGCIIGVIPGLSQATIPAAAIIFIINLFMTTT